MRAVYFNEHGGPEQLIYGELPDPAPGVGEVLVRVRACGMNHADIWVRGGLPFLRVKKPFVLGQDVAGEVAAVGSDVHGIAVGDRVILNPGISCGRCERCLSGQDNLWPEYQLLGKNVPGGYAELVKIPAQNVVPLPDGIEWQIAACIPVAFGTAWNMLLDQAKLRPAEWVLVHAGGSGVGSAAIQIARMIGATVITTAGSDEKLEKAAALGAQYTINCKTQDFLREVLADGPVAVKDIQREAREAGIADKTLGRAREGLGIKPNRRGGLGGSGTWEWELPAKVTNLPIKQTWAP